jgi:penicillin amidase
MVCGSHRTRYGRLWRLLTVRVIGCTAVATLAGAALGAVLFPPAVPAAVLVLGAAGIGVYAHRVRARLAMETWLVRALAGAAPTCPGEVTIAGLSGPVQARVRSDGVTEIESGSWLDAIRALGYVMARDRGFQLDLMRRTAGGRLAQVWGKAALSSDRQYRALDLAPAAARAAQKLAPPEQELLDAFSSGVNAAWERHGPPFECRFLGYRPTPWVPADSLLVALLMYHSLSWNEPAKRAEAVTRQVLPPAVADFFLPGLEDPPLPAGLADLRAAEVEAGTAERLVLVDRGTAGSNCWVRSGGPAGPAGSAGPSSPVLAGDLHLPLAMPNLLYQVDLSWSGGQVHGLTAAGLPVVLVGSNGRLAWGVTNLGADVLDLVPVTGQTRARTERIHVRGQPDVLLDAARIGSLPVSARPLLGQQVALRWTGYDPRSLDLRFQRLAGATSVEEGIAVLDDAHGIALNVLLTDGSGRMAHLATGLLPRRPAGHPASVPAAVPAGGVPAAEPYHHAGPNQPGGEPEYLTGPERPRQLDPAAGFLVSANDAALPEHHFRIGYDPDPGHRARRLRQLLAGTPGTGPAMREMQHDLAAGLYQDYRDLAVPALRGQNESLADLLAGWDGTAAAGSRAFGVLVRLRQILAQQVLTPYLAACRTHDPAYQYPYQMLDRPLLAILRRHDPALLPRAGEPGGWAAFMAGCAEQAAELAAATGRRARLRSWLIPPWAQRGRRLPRWGRVNTCGLRHPLEALAPWSAALLGVAPRPQPGALHVVRTCVPGFGSAGRAVLAPGPGGLAAVDLPGGQSGHPLSPHFADRHEEWSSAPPRVRRPPRVRCRYVLRPDDAT